MENQPYLPVTLPKFSKFGALKIKDWETIIETIQNFQIQVIYLTL